jgi:protein-S-isoprenylcysteine O-methyltransferase Ste14
MMEFRWADRTFRQARDATPHWNLAKTLGQVAVFWVVFLVIIPGGLLRMERALGVAPLVTPVGRPVLWLILVAAGALGLTSGVLMAVQGAGTPLPFDAPRRLVVRGPYRYVRNPMAIAGLTQGACVALLLQSWFALAMIPAGFVVWNYGVRPLEERHLELVFGEEFRRYKREIRCWIPRFRARQR